MNCFEDAMRSERRGDYGVFGGKRYEIRKLYRIGMGDRVYARAGAVDPRRLRLSYGRRDVLDELYTVLGRRPGTTRRGYAIAASPSSVITTSGFFFFCVPSPTDRQISRSVIVPCLWFRVVVVVAVLCLLFHSFLRPPLPLNFDPARCRRTLRRFSGN